MRKTYEEQLETLHVELIQMGALCERAISAAVKTLVVNNETLVKEVSHLEQDIDQKERDIESLCMKMLIRQQPVAGDLRLISAAMKMISDMERIGDQAFDIADITRHLEDKDTFKDFPIKDMAEATIRMVTDSVDSFVRRDVDLARKVMEADDFVDGKFQQIKDLAIEMLTIHPEESSFCMDLVMVAKYYERIGDHAVNIAEWVEYSITGERAGDIE